MRPHYFVLPMSAAALFDLRVRFYRDRSR